ncbi:hypothetical protein DS885_03900 [Psychromonas sp. B3M02]|nr:hypothetical protein DS885_03900 [Psychromonas sp. B3M02]
MASLLSLAEGNRLDANGEILCSFYKKENVKEDTLSEEFKAEDKKQNEDNKQDGTLTNKEVGELCLAWLYEQAKNKSEICYIKEERLFIKSPSAFIAYGKETKRSWKSIQKGVIKLGRHLPNPENNTPFIKIENKNMIVIV